MRSTELVEYGIAQAIKIQDLFLFIANVFNNEGVEVVSIRQVQWFDVIRIRRNQVNCMRLRVEQTNTLLVYKVVAEGVISVRVTWAFGTKLPQRVSPILFQMRHQSFQICSLVHIQPRLR